MPQTIDVTGLPPLAVQAVEVLVATLRGDADQVRQAVRAYWPGPPGETAEEWVERFRAWTESHPKRDIVIGDDRGSIYDRRSE